WEALDAIAAAAGARLYFYRADGRIELVRKPKLEKDEPQPVCRSGAFRVALRRLVALRDFETGARGYTASLEVAGEPGFLGFYLETRPQDLRMLDAGNNPVRLPALGSAWTAVDGRRALSIDVTLPALPRSAGKISLLRGTLPVRGPSRLLTF